MSEQINIFIGEQCYKTVYGEKVMDKYPLIGVSICAVVLLILGSLTNVVGYQSVKSTAVNDSPLFTTRTQRATKQQHNILTSQYLGKGKVYNLLILSRPDKSNSVYEIISRIQAMDDVSFQRFVKFAVNRLSEQERLKVITPQNLIAELYKIRDNTHAFTDDRSSVVGNITWSDTPTLCWYPGCIVALLQDFILYLLEQILEWFFSPGPTNYLPTYNTCHCCIMGKTYAKQY